MGGEGGWLQKVEQTKQLLNAVLQRSASQKDPVLEVKALQTLKELAVSILESVSFIDDHHTPLDVLKLTLISCVIDNKYECSFGYQIVTVKY